MPDDMRGSTQHHVEDLLHTVAVVGAVAACVWVVAAAFGTATGALWPEYQGSLRLAIAALVVTGPSATVRGVRERSLRRLSPDERFGFAVHGNDRATAA